MRIGIVGKVVTVRDGIGKELVGIYGNGGDWEEKGGGRAMKVKLVTGQGYICQKY